MFATALVHKQVRMVQPDRQVLDLGVVHMFLLQVLESRVTLPFRVFLNPIQNHSMGTMACGVSSVVCDFSRFNLLTNPWGTYWL